MSGRCPSCGAKLSEVLDSFCPECRSPLDEETGAATPKHVETGRQELLTPADIKGAESLTWEMLADEVRRGGRLVVYHYCVSIILLTMLEPSKIHLVRAGESALGKGWPCTIMSMLLGWWGIPWGFIQTPTAISMNLRGGTDVTASIFRLPPSEESEAS